MHTGALDLHEVIVFLVAAGVIVPLLQRFRLSPILGFLLVGVAIGPYGLARLTEIAPALRYVVIADVEGVRALAELGVVFLLFMIGLELSPRRLWAMRRLVFGLGAAQVAVSAAIITAVALAFDNSLPVALVLGLGFALSSTAIVMQILTGGRRLGTETGQTSFAILLFQDLAVLPILFLVSVLAAQSGQSVWVSFGWALAEAVIAVLAILVAGRLLIRPLFRLVGMVGGRDMFLALVLLVVVGAALATQEMGLSMALGAFLAGLLLAETEYRHEIEVDIEPFKGLLLGLFFVSVGMSVDPAAVADRPLWLAASVVGIFLIKSPVIYLLARLYGRSRSASAESALLLGQGGEFAFLIVGLAVTLKLMPGDVAQFMLIVTSLSMFATPLVAQAARRLALRIETPSAADAGAPGAVQAGLSGHVIVVGYGRVGQMIGAVLDEQRIAHVALDTDAELVAGFRARGANVYFGDASRPEMLESVAVDGAAALVVTMDDPHGAELVVEQARRHWPRLPIYARTRDTAHAVRLISLGANHAVPDAVEASLQLGELVLIGAGVPESAARQLTEARRQMEQAVIDSSGE